MSKVFVLTPEIPETPASPVLRTAAFVPGTMPVDQRGRPLRDLRISVTDRCNFRCTYCMPREEFGPDHPFMPHASLLRFEEILRVAQAAVALGVRKLRLTGGEPLLRKDIEKLVAMLAALRTPDGEPVELALTTNGTLLARKARALRDAGLRRVSVSLDALDDTLFRRLSDSDVSVHTVLEGIEAAAQAGLHPVKVNMVVRKGLNDGEILPMARHFRGSGHILRFIEYMDVGSTNGWNPDEVMTGRQILDTLGREYTLEQVAPGYRGEVAARWRYADGAGEIGVITSVSQPFCGDCSRARLSPEGRLYLCLFAHQGYDIRAVVRGGASDDELRAHLAGIWGQRDDRYSELRGRQQAAAPKIEMSYIGG